MPCNRPTNQRSVKEAGFLLHGATSPEAHTAAPTTAQDGASFTRQPPVPCGHAVYITDNKHQSIPGVPEAHVLSGGRLPRFMGAEVYYRGAASERGAPRTRAALQAAKAENSDRLGMSEPRDERDQLPFPLFLLIPPEQNPICGHESCTLRQGGSERE